MPELSFSKKAKLIKTDEFSSVFNFRKRISTQHLALHYLPNHQQHARLGLVVGKKVAKRAVDRNYMRRVLREYFRLHQHEITHADIVIRVQKKFSGLDFDSISHQLDELMLKLNRKNKPLTAAVPPINLTPTS